MVGRTPFDRSGSNWLSCRMVWSCQKETSPTMTLTISPRVRSSNLMFFIFLACCAGLSFRFLSPSPPPPPPGGSSTVSSSPWEAEGGNDAFGEAFETYLRWPKPRGLKQCPEWGCGVSEPFFHPLSRLPLSLVGDSSHSASHLLLTLAAHPTLCA